MRLIDLYEFLPLIRPVCYYSIQTYHMLRGKGFTKVARDASGLMDWQDAGYPLEGSLAQA